MHDGFVAAHLSFLGAPIPFFFFCTQRQRTRSQLMVVAHEVIRGLTHRMLTLLIDELAKDDTKTQVQKGVVEPLIKMLHHQLMPYFVVFIAIILLLLIMTLTTLILSVLFYLKR